MCHFIDTASNQSLKTINKNSCILKEIHIYAYKILSRKETNKKIKNWLEK